MRYVFHLSKAASFQIWLEYYANFYKELPLKLESGMIIHYPRSPRSLCNAEANSKTADLWASQVYTGFTITERVRKL
jgi:hypothetical protein